MHDTYGWVGGGGQDQIRTNILYYIYNIFSNTFYKINKLTLDLRIGIFF